MNAKYIAAVELGSYKIKGTIAAVDHTAGITVLAAEETPAADSVRYGRVQNAREASAAIEEVIRRLENNPAVAPASVSAVYVADGGRSLASAVAESTINLAADSEVTPPVLERLRKDARYNLATDREVLATMPRHYFADNAEVKNIVGAFGKTIRGEFTFITASPENKRNLDRVKITSHGRDLRREYVTRLVAQTDMALTDSDRQLGCLYIDFGAQTTTVAVFRDGFLQLASTLPMGSQNITRDLATGLSMTEESAENLKLTKGEAVSERANIEAPDSEAREVINYVSARVGEIVANVVHMVTKAGIKLSELTAGIVLSGGGSRLKGFDTTLEALTKLKVRRAAVDRSIRAASPAINLGEMFDLVALVKYAADHFEMGCLEFPSEAGQTGQSAESTQSTQSAPMRRRIIDDNDPNLLVDDELITQPANINIGDDPEGLPEPDPDPVIARKNLLERLKNWIAPRVDDNLDDEEEE